MVDQSLTSVRENEKWSIREFAQGVYGGLYGDGAGFLNLGVNEIIPPYGTFACDFRLRIIHYLPHNVLWSGAHDIWIQKFLSTPYEISGGRNLTFKWQDIFFESDFGEGYDYMMSKALSDYLVLNRGMFLEKVAYGATDTPLDEGARIVGLNHLDALRIWFTGNLEVPYIYQSEVTGAWHRMHRTRVIHLANMPSPNTRMFGMGKSPLYSALSTVNCQILLGKHQNELLSDLPPPGLIVFSNIKGEDIDLAMSMFEAERRRDGESVYRAPMRIEGLKPDAPVTVTFTPLAQVPEGFDYEKYQNQHVNMLALAMGLDPQDIWPLTSNAALGTATQSKELSAKTEVKGPGYLITKIEREWNRVTPRPLEFKYKAQNLQQDKSEAERAGIWVNQVILPAKSGGVLTAEEARQMLANQVEQFSDVLIDENGDLIRLPDDDPKEPAQVPMMIPVTTGNTAEDTTANDTTSPGQTEAPKDETTADDTEQISKEYTDTKSAFTDDVAAILEDAVDGGVSKAAFSARMRSSINTYGKAAYKDGLVAGGVEDDSLSGDDSDTYAALLASQSGYVSDIANRLYKEDGTLIASPQYNAGLWANKTLTPFYQAGVVSADKNGMYEWQYGDTEHCDDCLRLNGQKHRMKDWMASDYMPQGDNLECRGFNCQCQLKKTTGKAKGNY